MKKKDRDLLQRALVGELREDEEHQFDALLKSSAKLREEFLRNQKLNELVMDSRTDSFKPFFATRVLQRINSEAREKVDFSQSLARIFRRVAVASAILICTVMAYNVSSQWESRTERSVLELALNLTPATVETSLQSITGTL